MEMSTEAFNIGRLKALDAVHDFVLNGWQNDVRRPIIVDHTIVPDGVDPVNVAIMAVIALLSVIEAEGTGERLMKQIFTELRDLEVNSL